MLIVKEILEEVWILSLGFNTFHLVLQSRQYLLRASNEHGLVGAAETFTLSFYGDDASLFTRHIRLHDPVVFPIEYLVDSSEHVLLRFLAF